MARNITFQPSWASAPGDTIADCLHRRGLTVLAFATLMQTSSEVVSRLLTGQIAIDQDLAERLHRVVGGTARFWLNRESEYQVDLKRLSVVRDMQASRDWLRQLPVHDMMRFGWIASSSDQNDLAVECLRFFGSSSVNKWHERYGVVADVVAFRSSASFESHPGAVAAWLRRGELEAYEIECGPWDSDRFRIALQEIRALTWIKNPMLFVPKLQRLCAKCGVAVVIVRAPQGCRASGATKFIKPKQALLLLSFRYRSDDHFWFTFFHEASHLLLHDQKALFVEGTNMLSTHEEEEASDLSARILVPPEHHGEMLNLKDDHRAVIRFARHVGIAPGIIVGQLEHRGIIARSRMNYLKRRFVWKNESKPAIREME